jgi:hypothetical protein
VHETQPQGAKEGIEEHRRRRDGRALKGVTFFQLAGPTLFLTLKNAKVRKQLPYFVRPSLMQFGVAAFEDS